MKRVVGGGGEAGGVVRVVSEALPGSSFRELDDVFLQTQARIWLGEVLHLRFDEETSMADLISDGELLFQVSKILWKKLVKKQPDLNHSELHIHERTSSGKNDGRYLRYTKVDSFLKICQILGLKGVDLFTPSDVVDKRDTRKVCMCIRSLSMKSRFESLPVPDFDVVTYTIAMPNYKVGGICRDYLERTKSGNSSSSFRQKDELNYDSDEVESCLSEIEFETPKSKSNSQFDIIQSDLHEEIGENFAEIIEEKQRDSVSDTNPIFEKEISEINILPSTSSCESSVGDSWQGQNGNFTPESKLVVKNEVETEMEMENSSNRISDGDKNCVIIMENSSSKISDGEESTEMISMENFGDRISNGESRTELGKNDDIFTEELISDFISEFDDPILESENVVEDLNSEDLTVQNAEMKISGSEFSESKFLEEFDDPNLDDIIADFCEKIVTGNEEGAESQIQDFDSVDSESEIQDLNGQLSGRNVGNMDCSEFSTSQQNLNSEIELEEKEEKIEEELKDEKDEFINPIETEQMTEECEDEDLISEKNSTNKVQNQNLGQKVFTSVAGGVTLAGVLLIFLQMRKRSKGRNIAIGLQSPVKKAKEETHERNNLEIKKPKTVYPTEWLKI